MRRAGETSGSESSQEGHGVKGCQRWALSRARSSDVEWLVFMRGLRFGNDARLFPVPVAAPLMPRRASKTTLKFLSYFFSSSSTFRAVRLEKTACGEGERTRADSMLTATARRLAEDAGEHGDALFGEGVRPMARTA